MKGRVLYRIIFAAVLLFFIIWGGLVIAANVDAAEPAEERIYSSIKICAGDTLWSIAESYCEKGSVADYVQDLKEINGLKNDRALKPGASLIVYRFEQVQTPSD